ncbi:MAG: D-tyrosyl-tRNA(Tyr) deacylase [Lachnospiraceae bacterium]|nr:D-tyrosyl-tRNA(Tyr) deacylase [Lachnospiraceae bacterium]
MKAVITRVTHASVTIEGNTVGSIGNGYLILLGVVPEDDESTAKKLADKIVKLRVFADEDGKMNLSILDVGGAALVVSQFTLMADCRKGNRPSFVKAAGPDIAVPLYEKFKELLRGYGLQVEHGEFGADMQVASVNDGPVTIIMDTKELTR